MKAIIYLLAVICIVLAIVYVVVPAGSLPSFIPGFEAGGTGVHIKHGVAAAALGVILFVIGRFVGGRS
jgi:hypothetical protein